MSTITPGIEVFLGNTRYVNLRLRSYGTRDGIDVSGAQSILVEFARDGEAPLPAIACSSVAPGADWLLGKVPVLVSPGDITARVGTYYATVTVFESPLVTSMATGTIEVKPRPITSGFTLTGGTIYTARHLMAGLNATESTILAGQLVGRNSFGLTLASAATGGVKAEGIAIANAPAGTTCLYVVGGYLTLASWSASFGAASLPLNATFYLSDTDGLVVDTAPVSSVTQLTQIVGTTGASDAQKILVTIGKAGTVTNP